MLSVPYIVFNKKVYKSIQPSLFITISQGIKTKSFVGEEPHHSHFIPSNQFKNCWVNVFKHTVHTQVNLSHLNEVKIVFIRIGFIPLTKVFALKWQSKFFIVVWDVSCSKNNIVFSVKGILRHVGRIPLAESCSLRV